MYAVCVCRWVHVGREEGGGGGALCHLWNKQKKQQKAVRQLTSKGSWLKAFALTGKASVEDLIMFGNAWHKAIN